MSAINRLRQWVTTAFGIILMAAAITMYVLGKFQGHQFDIVEIVLVSILGWIFLMAKDSILEGIFLGIFKAKK